MTRRRLLLALCALATTGAHARKPGPKPLIDAPAILGKTEAQIVKALGKPKAKEEDRLTYARGKDEFEIELRDGKAFYIGLRFEPKKTSIAAALAAANVKVKGKPDANGRWTSGFLSRGVKSVSFGGEPNKIDFLNVASVVLSDAG